MRPDHVRCVLKPRSPEHLAWCGASAVGFFFVDVDHALANGEQGGRLLMCPDCEVAICAALRTASSGAKPVDVERMDELTMIDAGAKLALNVLGGNVVPLGAPRPRLLTSDEQAELTELKRRFEARYRAPSTLPPEVRAEVDRVLAAKKRRGGGA